MKPAVIILDMSTGYNWAPGGFGYDLVDRVRRLKDAAHAAGVPVIYVMSARRPTDNKSGERLFFGGPGLDVIPELHPVDDDTIIYKRFTGGFSHNGNPIPSSATLANIQFPAINKTAIALGTSFALTEKVDLVGSLYYAFPHTNTGTILEIPGTTVELRQELTTISLGFAFEL